MGRMMLLLLVAVVGFSGFSDAQDAPPPLNPFPVPVDQVTEAPGPSIDYKWCSRADAVARAIECDEPYMVLLSSEGCEPCERLYRDLSRYKPEDWGCCAMVHLHIEDEDEATLIREVIREENGSVPEQTTVPKLAIFVRCQPSPRAKNGWYRIRWTGYAKDASIESYRQKLLEVLKDKPWIGDT